MTLKLKALEKNVLKYRAFQMILLMHELESLREFLIGSIRCTDKYKSMTGKGVIELPEGTKRPFQKALTILVEKNILSGEESSDLQQINEFRNTIGHAIHNLVDDISHPESNITPNSFDYKALERLNSYRNKIEKGLRQSYVKLLSLRGVAFEQAELTYKEELNRLKKKIHRQNKERLRKHA